MFRRLFGRTAPTSPRETPPAISKAPQDHWTVAEAAVDALPLLIRFRSFPPPDDERQQYPTLIVIGWPYEPGNDSGMPDAVVSERMNQLEELLDTALEVPRIALQTAVVTGNARREWQWYTRSVTEFMTALNDCLRTYPPFPIELSHQADPDWSAYLNIQTAAI